MNYRQRILEPLLELVDTFSSRNALAHVLKGRSRDVDDFKKGRFNSRDIELLKTSVLEKLEPLLEKLPEHRDLGSRRMVRLAAVTLATYQALLERGVQWPRTLTVQAAVSPRFQSRAKQTTVRRPLCQHAQ